MNKKIIIIGVILAVALGGGFLYRSTNLRNGAGEQAEKKDAGHKDEKEGAHEGEKAGAHEEGKEGHKEEKEGHDEHGGEVGSVKMTAEVQKQNGVVVATVKKQRLAGTISVTGKVEANADRIAHVSPRISGKIVAVRVSLGDSVSAGQSLATLDSVELGEALGRYHQSKTKLALAQSSMDRIKGLVEKKIGLGHLVIGLGLEDVLLFGLFSGTAFEVCGAIEKAAAQGQGQDNSDNDYFFIH